MSLVGDRLDQLRRIPLPVVLRETGAQRDRYDKAKWHTPKGTISITGLKFMNWQRSAGGGGAIDLAMHLNGFGFPAAVAWLQRHFPLPMVAESPPAARRLALPPPDRGRLSAVKHYLVQDRAIPPAMTNALIASGTLYADRRGNAVFLLLRNEVSVAPSDGAILAAPQGATVPGLDGAGWPAPSARRERQLVTERASAHAGERAGTASAAALRKGG